MLRQRWKGPHGRHSLFFKVLVALVVTALFLNLAIALFFRELIHGPGRETGHRHIQEYAHLLIRELGQPPDYQKAAALAERLKLKIAIRGPNEEYWSIPNGFHPSFSKSDDREIKIRKKGPLGMNWKRGRLHVAVSEGGWDYVFAARLHSPGHDISPLQLFWLLSIVTLGVAFAWTVLRRMLQPLKTLEKGVIALQKGDLDHRLPEEGHGELAALSRSFNAMAHSLREKLRARDQLLRDVSHELRSPLTRMRLALELSPEGDWRIPIQEDINSLDAMVAELLESQRLDTQAGALQLSETRLDLLVEETAKEFLGQSPDLSLSALPNATVMADPVRLRIVLRNIMGNAIKHSNTETGVIKIWIEKMENQWGVFIRDQGPGIPQEQLNLVFEPFYRLDAGRTPGQGGYGLGLPLSKRIAIAHGGSLTLENAQEGGIIAVLMLREHSHLAKSRIDSTLQ
jgi:signal transduction histidine kinase